MIHAAGKWLYGAFALLARDAARRFVGDLGTSSSRRSFWRPIILRWQRRRQCQVNLSAARSASRAAVALFPQFHFHYATHRNERTHHYRVSAPVAATRFAATRAVVVHHHTHHTNKHSQPSLNQPDTQTTQPNNTPLNRYNHTHSHTQHQTSFDATTLSPQLHPARRALCPFNAHQQLRRNIEVGSHNHTQHQPSFDATTFSPQPHPAYRALRPFNAHEYLRRNIEVGLIGTLRSPKKAGNDSIKLPAVNRLRRWQFEKTAEPVRAGLWRPEQTTPFLTQSRIWQHWLQIFHSRSLTTDPVADRSQPHKAARMQFDLAEELVWRRVLRPTTEAAQAERRQEVSDSVQRPALRTFQSHEATPKSAAIEQSTVPQIIKLDPSFLDRLTDDVIRRVEKRAQIERQRRGL